MKPREPAHARPRVCVARPRPTSVAEVEEELAVRGYVATLLVDPPLEPGAVREHVARRVPRDDLIPSTWSSAEDRRHRGVTRGDHEETARHENHFAYHESPGSVLSGAADRTTGSKVRPLAGSGFIGPFSRRSPKEYVDAWRPTQPA